ncbi:MAG TPA: tetratricopeptide repeat protein, partial [Chthonomonadaceae bacterium]|nr:tetratricopeptide repeat protein [Chthonomonadaceae bacterium]
NCEHLVAACAEVASALLRSCPGVKIIASSRQGLNVPGEILYPVPPLALPDPRRTHTPASLSQFEAVQLFVDRALAVRPDFAVSNANAPALAQLCCRLDGIPLALELAAARVRMLSVEEINARLDNRFRLLTGGSRTALPRQQTLRALIDWSYDILNEPERVLFARLSVFSDGWSLAAAEIICAGDDVDAWDVFDLVSSLVDKSLVVSESLGGDTRFRMLETLREYGREKLEASGVAAAISERQGAYFAEAVAERASADELSADAVAWLTVEAGNIRASLDWFWAAGRYRDAMLLAVNLSDYWYRKGWLREANDHLSRAVQQLDAADSPALRSRVLKDAGFFNFMLNDVGRAAELTGESVDWARKAGDGVLEANALNILALICRASGEVEKARALHVESIDVLRRLGREAVVADYLMNLGLLESEQGERESAEARFAEARAIYEKHGYEYGIAHWECDQSDFALRDGDWQRARTLAASSVERFRRLDNPLGVAYALTNFAAASARLGAHEPTEQAVSEVITICRETSHYEILPVLLAALARVRLAQARPESVMALLAAIARFRSLFRILTTPDDEADFAEMEAAVIESGAADLTSAQEAASGATTADQLLSLLQPELPA